MNADLGSLEKKKGEKKKRKKARLLRSPADSKMLKSITISGDVNVHAPLVLKIKEAAMSHPRGVN